MIKFKLPNREEALPMQAAAEKDKPLTLKLQNWITKQIKIKDLDRDWEERWK